MVPARGLALLEARPMQRILRNSTRLSINDRELNFNLRD